MAVAEAQRHGLPNFTYIPATAVAYSSGHSRSSSEEGLPLNDPPSMPASITSERGYFDKNGAYVLPADAPEHDRLDAQSEALIAIMDGRPLHAPVQNPKRILDIGCGTGAMTVVLADAFPEAQVIGIDLAPVPDRGRSRPNVSFVQGDVHKLVGTAGFEPGSFDYVFHRLLILGIQDWPTYLSKASSLLKPGGWLESHEVSMTMRDASGKAWNPSWLKPLETDAAAVGLDIYLGEHLEEKFRAVGSLENIKSKEYEMRSTGNPKVENYVVKSVPGLFVLVTRRVCGAARGEEETEKLVGQINETFKDGIKEGENFAFVVVTGQKKG